MTLPANKLQDGLLNLEKAGVLVILTLKGTEYHVELQVLIDGNKHTQSATESYPNQALTAASQALMDELRESHERMNAVARACDFITDYVEEATT